MTEPTSYGLSGFGQMIVCEPRMRAYAKALEAAVTPGCTVIDIGAGTGIFSLLACRYGAGRVIAIEPNDAIELLRPAAAAQGHAERIHIFKGLSTEYVAPRRADVIISDIRSCLPLFEQAIPTLHDARTRLLVPGGRMIPEFDRLYLALVESEGIYAGFAEPWLANAYGVDLSAAFPYVVNGQKKVHLEPEELISEPLLIATLDYRSIDSPHLQASMEIACSRAATAHGFAIWFDSDLSTAAGFSNAPGAPPLIYGQIFFPFERPLALEAGDGVAIALRAVLVEDQYVWTWETRQRRGTGDAVIAQLTQSTFRGTYRSPDSLRRKAGAFVPQPVGGIEVDRLALSLIDGARTQQEIADAIRSAFPALFPTPQAALSHVVRLAQRYKAGLGEEH